MSQACSIGFRSGDLAGQSRVSIPSLSRKFMATRAICARALSCIRMTFWPIAHAIGTATGLSTSSLYLIPVSEPLSIKIGPYVRSNRSLPRSWRTHLQIHQLQQCYSKHIVLLDVSIPSHAYHWWRHWFCSHLWTVWGPITILPMLVISGKVRSLRLCCAVGSKWDLLQFF